MKDRLISIGGNEWIKENLHRVYLNDSALSNFVELSADEITKIKRLKPAKKITYYCVNSDSFYSANGTIIRNAIRAQHPNQQVNKI